MEEVGFGLVGVSVNDRQEDISVIAVKDSKKFQDNVDHFFKHSVHKGTIPTIGFNSDIPGSPSVPL
jgi:hypothetical protein